MGSGDAYTRQKGIGALLLMSQAGNISGYALADVLTGKETPSGHLAMTWAENYSDYPSAPTFSHLSGNLDDSYYHEGIYVGYRYFDTFGIKPAYPFGYGLSYTEFEIHSTGVLIRGENLEAQVTVTNVGKQYAGREVVQVYYSSPAGVIEKPYQELAGFSKIEMARCCLLRKIRDYQEKGKSRTRRETKKAKTCQLKS